MENSAITIKTKEEISQEEKTVAENAVAFAKEQCEQEGELRKYVDKTIGTKGEFGIKIFEAMKGLSQDQAKVQQKPELSLQNEEMEIE